MAKVLYVTANPKEVNESFGLSVGEEFLKAYKEENPNDEIVRLDLFKEDIPYIDIDVFNGWGKLQKGTAFDELDPEEKRKVSRINELTDQFVAVDKYVFVTPLWNLSFPAIFKTYIDNVAIAGKTFKYTESGPVGLLTDKKAIHIQARGGIYEEGQEFGHSYIEAILKFMGVSEIESLFIEGMNQNPEKAEEIKEKAIEEARKVAKNFAKTAVQV